MTDYEIFDSFFDYQVKWMYAGIEATMAKKESYHTCALTLSTYTEIMGGLVTGKLRKELGESRKNYEAFLPYLGQKYVNLDNLIKTQYPDRLRNLYSAVRSKLVHEFSLRESHMFVSYEKLHDEKIGIELLSNRVKDYEAIQINFLIPEYYRDFKNGIDKYYDGLKKWDETLIDNFFKSTKAIHYSEKPSDNLDNTG